MSDRALHRRDDEELASALRELRDAVDWPVAARPGAPDVATRVRARIVATPPRRRSWRSARRGLVLAILALLAFAAVAGAIGLGLPGLRFTFGDPTNPPPTPVPSRTAGPGAPGSGLGLGRPVAFEELARLAPRPVVLPSDPTLGAPDAAYVDPLKADQVAFVWAADERLPSTLEPGVGMILMTFDGRVEEQFFNKVIGGDTVLERVTVGDLEGYWVSGDPHIFFYERNDGGFTDDSRRWVGDALIWTDGDTTYRIESALGRDATIAIAETVD